MAKKKVKPLTLSALPLALVGADSGELTQASNWLAEAQSQLSASPSVICPHFAQLYSAVDAALAAEISRREAAANLDHLLSPYATQVISQMLAYALKRLPSCNSWSGSRLGLLTNQSGWFYADLRLPAQGNGKRGKHFDDVLMRVQSDLAEETAQLKYQFPLPSHDPEMIDFAERIQRVLIYAHITGTPAQFAWSLSGRALHGSFSSRRYRIKSGIKQARTQLAEAVLRFESAAAIKV